MDDKTMVPLASEMYEDLKRANQFKEKLIYILLGIIFALIGAVSFIGFFALMTGH